MWPKICPKKRVKTGVKRSKLFYTLHLQPLWAARGQYFLAKKDAPQVYLHNCCYIIINAQRMTPLKRKAPSGDEPSAAADESVESDSGDSAKGIQVHSPPSQCRRVNGQVAQKLKEMGARQHISLPTFFICDVLKALVVGILVVALDLNLVGGIVLGVLLWVGITMSNHLAGHIASNRPLRAWGIETAYQLVSLALIGCILGVWR